MCWVPASNAASDAQATPPPTDLSRVLTTSSWPMRQQVSLKRKLALGLMIWYLDKYCDGI